MDSGNSSPIRFKSAPSRGGVVENITYRNLMLHETRQAISMEADWKSRAMARQPTPPPANPLPVFRNVKIINVSGDAQSVGVINGLADSPVEALHSRTARSPPTPASASPTRATSISPASRWT